MLPLLAALFAAAIAAGVLVIVLQPLLQRYALARPNARSSHRTPTPQGGGIAVLGGCFIALALAAAMAWLPPGSRESAGWLALAAALIGLIGAVDDIRPLPVAPRLAGQALTIWLALWAVGDGARLTPDLPLAVERAFEVFAGLWFVNLTNFMDGLDWLTVAGVTPMLLALALFGALAGAGGAQATLLAVVAAALCGGVLGFAPFNLPPARLFLGDVGSLAIGLIVAWLLFLLASGGALVPALLLPMYYCADATITLCRRLARGERVWEAHRQHFYQQAADRGWTALRVVSHVAVANVALAGLAALALFADGLWAQLGLLACGAGVTALLLARLGGRL